MSREKITRIIFISIVIIFVGVFVIKEYDKNNQYDKAINSVEVKIKPVNEVLLSMAPTKTLNPLISTDEDMFYINKLIYSSLFTFDENMTPEGDLVESYSFRGNNLSIVLKNAKWHDEKSVSADDIFFTVNVIKEIGEASPYFQKVEKIKSVTGTGNTIEIEFEDKFDMSLSSLAFPIVPKHKYKNTKEYIEDVEDFIPLGSGMYKFKSYDKVKALELDINSTFYDDKARSAIKINVIKPDANKTNMVESSNLTVLLDKSQARTTKINKKGMIIEEFPGNKVDFIGFNFQSEFMNNKELRKVVAHVMDREKIIEEDYFNSVVMSDSLYLPNYLGTESLDDDIKYDLDKASNILKSEEFKDTDDDGIVESKEGKKFSLTLIVDTDKPQRVEVAERLKKELRKIGVEINVEKLSETDYMNSLRNGKFDFYIGGMILDESMDFRDILYTKGDHNYINYSNKKVDSYLENMYNGSTIDDMSKNLMKFKKYLIKELPYYCIGYQTYGIVKAPVFAGTMSPTYNNPYREIQTWFSEYEERMIDDKEIE